MLNLTQRLNFAEYLKPVRRSVRLMTVQTQSDLSFGVQSLH